MNESTWARTVAEAGSGKTDKRWGRGYVRAALGVSLGIVMVVGVSGCHKTAQPASDAAVDQNGVDPANANLAPASGNPPAQVLAQNVQYQPQQQGEDYGPQGAPIERVGPGQSYNDGQYDNGQLNDQQAMDLYNADLTDAEASEPPPPLPEYDQPPAPDPNYIWTPGYWAWDDGGYYWVPGAWVEAPYVGALWTPGYWGYVGNVYRFHHGFWGLHIGFYGGIDYGYGYVGHGYYGGYWNGGSFYYNTAITRVNRNAIRTVYTHNVVIDNRPIGGAITNRVSFNGGRGGLQAHPLAAEVAVMHEQRRAPMAVQVQAQRQAAQNTQQFYKENHGRPAMTVAARPVAADRTPSAILPRAAAPAAQPGVRGDQRGGQPQGFAPGARPQAQPQIRTAPEARPVPQVNQVPSQQNRHLQQGQPAQPLRPQQQGRQAEPQAKDNQPQARPQPQTQASPTQPQYRQSPERPQTRQAEPQPQARPAPEARPAPQPRPQEQARPQPQAAAPAAHPQPQAAAPAAPQHPEHVQHQEPRHGDDKPNRQR